MNRNYSDRNSNRRVSSRTSSSRYSRNDSSYGRRKRIKNRLNYPMIAGAAVIGVLLISGTVWGVISLTSKGKTAVAVETTIASETELSKAVMVDNIVITGMSRAEAKETLMKNYTWEMKAVLSGAKQDTDTYEIKNLVEARIDSILEEVYTGAPKDTYVLDLSNMEEVIKAEIANMAKLWNVKAKNGSIAGFNKETGSFIYDGEAPGLSIDEESLLADIQEAISQKNFKTSIDVKSQEVEPDITEAEAKEMYKVIGTFTTTTTSNKDRNTNITLAASAMDGMIVKPGEEFSFNATTGNRTLAKGYKPAGAYLNGVLVEEPGGGVCQVSSTLYNAVVFSGLEPTERHAHSFAPSYVTPGEDAMVSYDGYAGPDMKFINTSKTAIAIRAKLVDQKLTVSIVGVPILEEGEKIVMQSSKLKDYDSKNIVYEEDPTMALGVEQVVEQGTQGSRWVTNIVRKKGDKVVSEKFFHNSTYKGKPTVIKRNTSGVVVSATGSIPDDTSLTIESTSAVAGESTSASMSAPGGETTKATKDASQVGPGAAPTSSAHIETSAASTEGSGIIEAKPSSP